MNCRPCADKVPDYVTGRLEPGAALEVGEHLEDCARCAEYAARVAELYALPDPSGLDAPGRLAFEPAATVGAGTPPLVRRAAGLVAVAATLGAVLFAWRWARSRDAHPVPEPPPSAVELTSIELQPPELPGGRPETPWVTSRSEAELLADYSGKPLLEAYVLEYCMRCRAVDQELRTPTVASLMDGFVCLRTQLADERVWSLPDELAETRPFDDPMMLFPLMRVRDDGCATEPSWAVASIVDVERVLADYYAKCADAMAPGHVPLDDELFDETLDAMRSLEDLVRNGRFAEALARLRRASALDEVYRTRFASEARRLEAELLQALEGRLRELARLPRRTARERSRAIELACTFRDQVRGLELEERVAPLCGS